MCTANSRQHSQSVLPRPVAQNLNASVDGECQGNADVCESSLNVDANGHAAQSDPLQRHADADADGAHHGYVHARVPMAHECVRARESRSDEATLPSP